MLKFLLKIIVTTLLTMNVAQAAVLKINVTGLKKIQGHLLVVLYESEASYMSEDSPLSATLKVTGDNEVVEFKSLDAGKYAVKLYHDENDNGKLDKNFLGIPKESYGFSNNGGQFGPPKYEDASFLIEDDITIDIKLN